MDTEKMKCENCGHIKGEKKGELVPLTPEDESEVVSICNEIDKFLVGNRSFKLTDNIRIEFFLCPDAEKLFLENIEYKCNSKGSQIEKSLSELLNNECLRPDDIYCYKHMKATKKLIDKFASHLERLDTQYIKLLGKLRPYSYKCGEPEVTLFFEYTMES